MIRAIQIAAVNIESEFAQESHIIEHHSVSFTVSLWPQPSMCWQDKRIVFTDTLQCPGGALKSHCPLLAEGNCWGTRESTPLVQEHESCLSSKMLISKAFNDPPSSAMPRLARSEHDPKPFFDP